MATTHYGIPEANRNSAFKTSDWNAALQKIDSEMWKLFQFRSDLGGSDDLNNLSGSGFWRIGGTAPLHAPGSGWVWCFFVQFVYGTVTCQYIIKPSTNGFLMREYSGNPQVWSGWNEIIPSYESGTIASGITYKKYGKVVTIYMNGVSVSAATGWTSLGTLPSSISTPYSVHGVDVNGIDLRASGTTLSYRGSAGEIYGVLTYVL